MSREHKQHALQPGTLSKSQKKNAHKRSLIKAAKEVLSGTPGPIHVMPERNSLSSVIRRPTLSHALVNVPGHGTRRPVGPWETPEEQIARLEAELAARRRPRPSTTPSRPSGGSSSNSGSGPTPKPGLSKTAVVEPFNFKQTAKTAPQHMTSYSIAQREAIVRGKIAALAFCYPTMMPKTITPTSYMSSLAPVAGLTSEIRVNIPSVLCAGSVYYGLVWITGGWAQKINVCTAVSTVAGLDTFSVAAPTITADPSLAQVGSFLQLISQGPMSCRTMNGTAALTQGGTMLCGQIPLSYFGSAIAWNTLLGYPGVQMCEYPDACDMTHVFFPNNAGDYGANAPSSAYGGISTCLFMAYQSTAQQVVNIEVQSTVNAIPLPTAQDFFTTKRYPLDRAAYDEALVAIAPPGNAMATKDIPRSFGQAVNILGKDVLAYIKRENAKLSVESGSSSGAAGFMVKNPVVERHLRILDSTNLSELFDGLSDPDVARFFPQDVLRALLILSSWNFKIRSDSIFWRAPNGAVLSFVEQSECDDAFSGTQKIVVKENLIGELPPPMSWHCDFEEKSAGVNSKYSSLGEAFAHSVRTYGRPPLTIKSSGDGFCIEDSPRSHPPGGPELSDGEIVSSV